MTISDILKKLHLKYEDLSTSKTNRVDPLTGLSEKEIYTRMEEIMKEEITVDKIKEFLRGELEKIQAEWDENPENTKEKDLYLKAKSRNYRALLNYIESPELARKKLEEYLEKVGETNK